LTALPGIIFAPTFGSKMAASIGMLIAVVVIALLLWPKPAPASSQAVRQ
jgi:hypothetical protein